MIEQDEIVMVPVPRRLLPAVYRVLADHMHEPRPSSETHLMSEAPPIGTSKSSGTWSQLDLQRLYAILRDKDLQAPIAMIDLVCARPSEQISFAQVREHTGLSLGVARQQLAQLTWNLKDYFDRDDWPVKVRSTGSGQVRYSIEDPDLPAKWEAAKMAVDRQNPE